MKHIGLYAWLFFIFLMAYDSEFMWFLAGLTAFEILLFYVIYRNSEAYEMEQESKKANAIWDEIYKRHPNYTSKQWDRVRMKVRKIGLEKYWEELQAEERKAAQDA